MPTIGFQRVPNEDETLDAIGLIERAVAERRAVRVTFFQENGRGWFHEHEKTAHLNEVFGRRKMLKSVPVTRVFEPQEWTTNAHGEPYASVISLSPTGEERPAMRTLRLDRVAVGRRGLRLEILDQPFKVTGTALDPQLTPRKGA